jgi:hypothetical protein
MFSQIYFNVLDAFSAWAPDNLGVIEILALSKYPSNSSLMYILCQKKEISRIFKISGTLIINMSLCVYLPMEAGEGCGDGSATVYV